MTPEAITVVLESFQQVALIADQAADIFTAISSHWTHS
jgi:hypothetical protein